VPISFVTFVECRFVVLGIYLRLRKQISGAAAAGEFRMIAPESSGPPEKAFEIGAQKRCEDFGDAFAKTTLSQQAGCHRRQACKLVGACRKQRDWNVARDCVG
jgi:hypothetical protein